MKKYIVMCIVILSCACLAACGRGTIANNLKTHEVDSKIYSKEDIDSAIETIKNEFITDWKGCTLTEIYYAGDEFADRNDADEVIVLLSTFDVDSSGGDGSLDPNSTYSNWNWILVRTNGGEWVHVDHGY